MDDLRIGSVTIPGDELKVRFTRSSGPGGQNVNKRSTRAEISFPVTTSRALSDRQRALALERLGGRVDARGRIHVVSSSGRTQAENRVLALARLQGLLADALRPPPRARRATKPSKGSVEKRIKQKKQRSEVKRARQKPRVDND
ncbi:MAG: aminoacyl-tRNA hydrolase [Actinobacteria bacterium]|nr:MAG: aminoacyl-tRNA hydrolase [Actinomycetota bacterium]